MRAAKSPAVLAISSAFVSHSPASADEPPRERKILYGDLDLTKARDVTRLERCIARAAKTVCGVESPMRTTAQIKCTRSALSRANRDVQLAVRDAKNAYAAAPLREGDAAEK